MSQNAADARDPQGARIADVDTSIEEEGRTDRILMGWQGWLFAGVAVVFSSFHLYTAYFDNLPHMQQRATHGLFGVVLALAFFSMHQGAARNRDTLPWYDWLLILCALLPMGYVLLIWQGMFSTGRTFSAHAFFRKPRT